MRRGKWATTRVEDVMVRPPRMTVLAPDRPLTEALEKLQKAAVDGLPVLEDGALVGMVTRRGIAELVKQAGKGSKPEPGATQPEAEGPTS